MTRTASATTQPGATVLDLLCASLYQVMTQQADPEHNTGAQYEVRD